MNNHSAEDYLDKLLNSVSDESVEEKPVEDTFASVFGDFKEDTEDAVSVFEGFSEEQVNEEPKSSRKVSKSEADFLKEFEAELAEEDLDGFFKNFGGAFDEPEDDFDLGSVAVQEEESNPLDVFAQMMPEAFEEMQPAMEQPYEEEQPATVDIPFVEESVSVEDTSMDSFSLDGVDLGALLNETSESSSAEGASVEDMFADMFGTEAVGGDAPEVSLGSSSESIDLSNLGEADLMSLLAGDDGLSDIGSMLSGENTDDMGGVDAFAMFAEGEMTAPTTEDVPEEDGKPKKKKEKKKKNKSEKGENPDGFFGKLAALLFGDDEDEEEAVNAVEINRPTAPTAEQLSGENAEILAAFQDIEERPDVKEKEKKKKD
ncbi:MAG: hypothetical protein IJO60_00810, partial [Agathobacter sp.]|nr:hypothetical protein [Agathobacter sp.]